MKGRKDIQREREREREKENKEREKREKCLVWTERERNADILFSEYYRFFDFGQKTEIGHGPYFE